MVGSRCSRGKCWFISLTCILTVFTFTTILNFVYHTNGATKLSSLRRSIRSNGAGKQTFSLFCEAIHLGCYKMKSNNVSGYKIADSQMNIKKCLHTCNARSANYIGIRGSECACGLELSDFAVLNLTPADQCNFACSGKSRQFCGGSEAYSVQRLVTSCVKGPFSSDFVQSRAVGCYMRPPEDSKFISFNATTATECYHQCQNADLHIAIYIMGECMCGSMDDKFNWKQSISCVDKRGVKMYRTLVEDKRCSLVRLLPPSKHRKITILASFPGSGNTWARYLLEKATGQFTGSNYKDRALIRSGFIGEGLIEHQQTAVVKDHLRDKHPTSDRSILIIRNPYEALLADFNRKATGNHTGIATRRQIREGFVQYASTRINLWKTLIKTLLASNRPLLIVHYKDLVQNPIGQIRRMVDFLPDLNISKRNFQDRLHCLGQEIDGKHKRKKSTWDFEPFTPELIALVRNEIDDVNKLLENANLPHLPRFSYPSENEQPKTAD